MINAIVVAFATAATALLCAYHLHKLRIAEFARRVTRGSRSQHEATLALARAIFSEVKRGRDPAFLLPQLASLGGSPLTILKDGGCCAGVHRLFITALDTLGIRAAQVTVYRRADPAAAHCLAQVSTEGVSLLIDVDYGVCLHHPDGGPIDLAGLRSGVRPVIHPFVFDGQASYADGRPPRAPGYPDRDYYRFDYHLSRTANWAETLLKRAAYAALLPITRGRVDCVLLPAILEWPEVLLAAALCWAAILLLAAGALTR